MKQPSFLPERINVKYILIISNFLYSYLHLEQPYNLLLIYNIVTIRTLRGHGKMKISVDAKDIIPASTREIWAYMSVIMQSLQKVRKPCWTVVGQGIRISSDRECLGPHFWHGFSTIAANFLSLNNA